MNISLTAELEQWVQQKVGSGFYASASEVVREGLRALHAKETRESAKLTNLRDSIQAGIESFEQNGSEEWTSTLSDEIKANGRKRCQA